MEFSIKKSSTRRSARVIARFPIWCSALFTYDLEPLWGGRRGREQAVKPGRSRPPPTRVAAQGEFSARAPTCTDLAVRQWRPTVGCAPPSSARCRPPAATQATAAHIANRPAWKTRWSSRPRGLRASTCSGHRWPRSGWPPRLRAHCCVTWQTHRTARLRSRSPRLVA
jgi:hypothetical protein